MEQTDQFNESKNPSYWASIGIAALIFAIITFALQLMLGYIQMSGNSGWLFTSISSVIVCLIGAFGGMMAVWHYSNEYDITMKLGRGALIGFLTGVAIVIVSIILNELWLLFDPDYYQKMMEASIANIESMDLPDEQEETTINRIRAGFENRGSLLRQLAWGIPITGILNLLTGMLGVQLFAKEEKDY